MNASEAVKISNKSNNIHLGEVYEAIDTYANQGDYFMHVYRLLMPEQIKDLEEKGYRVEDVSRKDETVYRISWEHLQKVFGP
jgi:hypothetical protein